MTVEEVVATFGGNYRKAGKRLGIAYTTFSHWKKKGIPAEWQSHLHLESGGKLQISKN